MSVKLETAARQSLVEMAQGYFRGKVLCAAVRLDIADILGDGEKSLEELAVATSSNPDSLYRLLRTLASIGIVKEVAPAHFVLTPLGQPLRRDASDSVWASIVFWADLLAEQWTYLAECVRTGNNSAAAMEREGVKSRWSKDPDAKAIFHAVFRESSADDMAPVVAAYDFSSLRVVADLGGAGGGLIAAILGAYPEIRGILVDRQEAVTGAALRLEAAGLAARCTLLAADLLEAVPQGADVYIMKSVLHGYEQANARRILQNCHAAMARESRLLLIEAVLPAKVGYLDPELEKVLMADLNMMTVTEGRERTETEWDSLLCSADFKLRRIVSVPGSTSSIIEAVVST